MLNGSQPVQPPEVPSIVPSYVDLINRVASYLFLFDIPVTLCSSSSIYLLFRVNM